MWLAVMFVVARWNFTVRFVEALLVTSTETTRIFIPETAATTWVFPLAVASMSACCTGPGKRRLPSPSISVVGLETSGMTSLYEERTGPRGQALAPYFFFGFGRFFGGGLFNFPHLVQLT